MISKRAWRSTVVAALAILFVSLAVSVRAHDFSRGAFRRTGVAGRRGPHAGDCCCVSSSRAGVTASMPIAPATRWQSP